ncbi:chain-length determining protein [Bacteroides sp. 214]|uniref:Wzz/FepE/Etk N-terminal domain-containing protein n=1 Tax=Bacteroides sp. 214 TaxID=2302935 RepID=UPI0013D3C3B3|nr:Wzz/FepE/Etk N-terminal domain-containing protein [Bacteroides sp. 214]NDW11534.1 chain-length determining protein [Bacteroides sp. 214]
MSENKDVIKTQSVQSEEQEIDLMELVRKVWDGRVLILKWCGVAAFIGLIVAFSIPREYETTVTLAPENRGGASGGSMGALAAMAGLTTGATSGRDALSPALYPDIVSSTPFLIELFEVPVVDKKGEVQTTLCDYLQNHQRSPWWSGIASAPFKILGWGLSLFKSKGEEAVESEIDPFRLTHKEAGIASQIASRIKVTVDNKSGVTSLSVTMQDPLISATIADVVMSRLQMHITNYRTTKARHDFEFADKLFTEAKANYMIAMERYAVYVDKNTNIVLESSKVDRTRLLNEMNLAYSLYMQLSQQLEVARAKVQEITPVYTVVQPASVPLSPVKPRKAMILIGFVFLAGVAAVGWILFVKDFIAEWKKPKTA